MSVNLLDRRDLVLEVYPERLAELLERRPRSVEALAELDRLHRRRLRLKCQCGRVLHVVEREITFLRRNPGQDVSGSECGLCKGTRECRTQIEAADQARLRNVGIGFILGTRMHPQQYEGEAGDRHEQGRTKNTLKYARGFGALFTLMERAGFTSLPATLPWTEMWSRIHDQLKRIPLRHGSRKTFADFCWLPGGFYQDGLRGLNTRLLRDWDHPLIQPEGWVFAILPELSESGEALIYSMSERMRRTAERRGETIWPPYRIDVPSHCVAPIGRTGPFLALAVASANSRGNPQFRTPRFHRLLLQSIAGEHNPIAVDSGLERDVVLLLQRRCLAFVKPVFDNADGLRPDFVLPGKGILIEVQGMHSDEYRERKREIHRRLLESREYPGHRLLTFEANNGESLEAFERRLLMWIP